MNYRDYLQKVIYAIINPLINGMIKVGVTPNIITAIGFLLNAVAAVMFCVAAKENSYAMIGWTGALILFAGLFDMMDGRLARVGNMSSAFGALWDSVLDRYSELLSLFGISCIFFVNHDFWGIVITFLAMMGSVMVSYVRARAEGLNIECKVGLLQRPERVVLTAVAAILAGIFSCLDILLGAMLVIAVLANLTAFWRVAHCYRALSSK
ncbi:MAG: CDP-alcohol phosphatidyltransferase family protein [Prevotella sp.]|jgi:CDP-diacylglycerol--glycerol-3-phosphate 3-phosphatidyltransferase|nr:CDP-alcohol phosphatidyltransferase family protein [Prevotella sp.]